MSPKYPSEVVEVFFTRERETADQLGSHPRPTQSELERLVETMLFASMATEEGQLTPVGIVFAESHADFQRDRWDVVLFKSPLDFEVKQISKYASACDAPNGLLMVVAQDQRLEVVGIATPHSRRIWRDESLLRIYVSKPGDVSISRGRWEIVRYTHGNILPRPTDVGWTGARHAIRQLDSIGHAALTDAASAPPHSVFYELGSIVEGMVKRRHGGILAVLGPEEKPDTFAGTPPCLSEPVRFGEAIRQMLKAETAQMKRYEEGIDIITRESAPPTEQDERLMEHARDAAERVARLTEQIAKLTTVDGAVVLSHQLDVIAFGAKLSSSGEVDLEVFSVDPFGHPGARFSLGHRGTRHRAAASFAKRNPDGLAFIVSQDGDAAMFVMHESKLVHWPLSI